MLVSMDIITLNICLYIYLLIYIYIHYNIKGRYAYYACSNVNGDIIQVICDASVESES